MEPTLAEKYLQNGRMNKEPDHVVRERFLGMMASQFDEASARNGNPDPYQKA